jgi:hypothetical protein
LIWDRKAEGRFPETTILKEKIMDHVDPGRDLCPFDHHEEQKGESSGLGLPVALKEPSHAGDKATDPASSDTATDKSEAKVATKTKTPETSPTQNATSHDETTLEDDNETDAKEANGVTVRAQTNLDQQMEVASSQGRELHAENGEHAKSHSDAAKGHGDTGRKSLEKLGPSGEPLWLKNSGEKHEEEKDNGVTVRASTNLDQQKEVANSQGRDLPTEN